MRLYEHDPECYTQLDDPDESECTCGVYDREINKEQEEQDAIQRLRLPINPNI